MAALLVAGLAAPAAAQSSSVSQSDIQRLQDNVFQAGNDVSQLRGRDSTRASQLQAELDDLRDEVVYLKVKLRKDPQGFARNEYVDVRDRIEDLRTRARGDATNAYSDAAGTSAAAGRASRHDRHERRNDRSARRARGPRRHRDGRAPVEHARLGHREG